MTVVCFLCQWVSVALNCIHSPSFPSSLPQEVVSKSCSTKAPLLSAFWLSSDSARHREEIGEQEKMEVDAFLSFPPSLIQDASGGVRWPLCRALFSAGLPPASLFLLLPLQSYVWLQLPAVVSLWVLFFSPDHTAINGFFSKVCSQILLDVSSASCSWSWLVLYHLDSELLGGKDSNSLLFVILKSSTVSRIGDICNFLKSSY